MGILLTIIAALLVIILSPFLIVFSLVKHFSFKGMNDYFFKIAVSIDQLGNVVGGSFFNACAITKDGFKFGSEDETISSVIGRNYQKGTLKLLGRSIRYYLDKIQPNHCVNSIGS